MKRLIHITILSVLLLAGCSKPSPAPAPAPEQYDRYIFFSHSVETKAELVEDAAGLNEKSFGVVGFKYDFYDKDGNEVFWKDHKNTNPTPNVFYDEVVNSEGTSTYDITPVETVWVTAGAQGTTTKRLLSRVEPVVNNYASSDDKSNAIGRNLDNDTLCAGAFRRAAELGLF